MFAEVARLSPVTITIFIPARLHNFTAFFAPFLGRSHIPINPTNERLFSNSSWVGFVGS